MAAVSPSSTTSVAVGVSGATVVFWSTDQGERSSSSRCALVIDTIAASFLMLASQVSDATSSMSGAGEAFTAGGGGDSSGTCDGGGSGGWGPGGG